jgi:hypothetical protein
MKNFRIYFLLLAVVTFLGGCIKNEEVVYTGNAVELDAATWNANSVGVSYPILTRKPAFGRAVSSSNASDSIMTRRSGTIQLRVNLVGPQRSTPVTVNYEVVTSATTAVAGTHYTTLPGTVTIPANSSFGYIDVQLLNPGATSGTKDLVIRLTGGTDVMISPNYNTVGLRISQS